MAVVDFNNDNRVDIVTANRDSNNVGALLGYGNGSFTDATTFSAGIDSNPYSITIADLNHDSQLDIAVANYATSNVGVLLGFGNGSFMNVETFSTGTGSSPCSVVVGDFNGDDQLDVVVANYDGNNIGMLLGLGNESFINIRTFSVGNNTAPKSVAIGDFNNDNQLDIVVANSGTNTVGVFLGFGNGTFPVITTYRTGDGSKPYCIAVTDLNNDTQLDIILSPIMVLTL